MSAVSQTIIKLKTDEPINGKSTGIYDVDQFGLDFIITDIFLNATEITGLVLLGPTISIGTNEDADDIMSPTLLPSGLLVVDQIVSLLPGVTLKNRRVLANTEVKVKVVSASGGTTYKFNAIIVGVYDPA